MIDKPDHVQAFPEIAVPGDPSNSMSSDDFRALAEHLTPLLREADDIRRQMIAISDSVGIQIVREAFPSATVSEFRVLAEVKPSDYARSAGEAVQMLSQHGLTPTDILHDTARSIILLAIRETPANPQNGRTRSNPRKAQRKHSGKGPR